MEAETRAKLYEEFLDQAAKDYGCKSTDMPAKLAATRRLTFEVYQARLIDGRDVDPATLRWMLEEESKHAPLPEIPRVAIEIVETLQGMCPRCGYTHDTGKPLTDPDPPPPPGPPTPPPPPFEGGKQTVDPSPSQPEAPQRPPESPTNVIEMRPRSIHHDDVRF
jgi:hypothetical protein